MTGFIRRALRGLAFACASLALLHGAHAGTYTQTRYPIVLVHGLFGLIRRWASITSTASPKRCAAMAPRSMWLRCRPPTAPRCAASNCWPR
jgi:hypothetical protein